MEKEQVRKYFFKAVKELPNLDPALRDALQRCENPHFKTSQSANVDRFVENLSHHIKHAQKVRMFKKGERPHSVKILKETIYDMVGVFCFQLERNAKLLHESDLAKTAREKKIQEEKDMEKTLSGTPSGVFEEMGLKFDESRDKKA